MGKAVYLITGHLPNAFLAAGSRPRPDLDVCILTSILWAIGPPQSIFATAGFPS